MKRQQFLRSVAGIAAGSALLPRGITAAAKGTAAAFPWFPEDAPSKGRQWLHQDYITYAPGIEYFHLGNGDIQAVLQYAPDQSGELPPTFMGVTVMTPERFTRKWSTFLYHPERGFAGTMALVTVGGAAYTVTAERMHAFAWKSGAPVPTVALTWQAGPCEVTEEFWVPAEGGLMFRDILLKNRGTAAVAPSVRLLLFPNFGLFDDIGVDPAKRLVYARGFTSMKLLCLDGSVTTNGRYELYSSPGNLAPGASTRVRYVYALEGSEKLLESMGEQKIERSARAYWDQKNSVVTGSALVDEFYAIARTGIKAMVARSGKRDGGFWEYQMEWVGDDALAAVGMVQVGMRDEAKVVLDKVLMQSIGSDGRTLEAGRFMPLEMTEFVQNGILLYGLWSYVAWTGDMAFLRKHWKTIRLIANFPLQHVFRDSASGLLHNKREWWERGDSFGVEDGFELAYQFWVAFGLEKAADLAAHAGDRAAAARWSKEAARLRAAVLENPKYRLIEDGHLIKRRTLDGRWQRLMIPPNRDAMPPGSPMATEKEPTCEPDTCTLWPITYGMVDPQSDLARATLGWVEPLWNQRWSIGGYPRYNVSSEPDPPAPWPIASMLVARAYAEAGDFTKMWRVLEWLKSVHGGRSGGWFERYGQSITPPAPPVGVVGWVWEEIVSLVLYNILGFRPGMDDITIRPRLPEGMGPVHCMLTVRGSVVDLTVTKKEEAPSAVINGKTVPLAGGAIALPYKALGNSVAVSMRV